MLTIWNLREYFNKEVVSVHLADRRLLSGNTNTGKVTIILEAKVLARSLCSQTVKGTLIFFILIRTYLLWSSPLTYPILGDCSIAVEHILFHHIVTDNLERGSIMLTAPEVCTALYRKFFYDSLSKDS